MDKHNYTLLRPRLVASQTLIAWRLGTLFVKGDPRSYCFLSYNRLVQAVRGEACVIGSGDRPVFDWP